MTTRYSLLASRASGFNVFGLASFALLALGCARPGATKTTLEGEPTTTNAVMQTPPNTLEGSPETEHEKGLAALFVTTRIPQLTMADSMNLGKVAEAFASATPDMIAHTLEQTAYMRGLHGANPILFSASTAGDGATARLCQLDEPEEGSKLKNYGLILSLHAQGAPTYRTPSPEPWVTCGSTPAAVGPDTPVLVWGQVSPGAKTAAGYQFARVVFVTPDGGRYVGSAGILARGASSKAPSATLVDGIIYPEDVPVLVTVGALPPKFGEAVTAAKTGWKDCTAKIWGTVATRIDEAGSDEPRIRALRTQYHDQTMKRCSKEAQKFETAMIAAIEQRNLDRKALFERMKGRVKK
jgi:hypothetical protein